MHGLYRDDNTEGYTDDERDALNCEFLERWSNDEWADFYIHEAEKLFTMEVARRYPTHREETTMAREEDLERLRRLEKILQHELGRENAQLCLIEKSMRTLEGSLIEARKLVSALGQALQCVQEQTQDDERTNA